MILHRCLPAASLALAALAFAGCNDSPESPSFFTDQTFTGSIVRQGFSIHAFSSQESGPLVITITTISPTTTMGLGLGVPVADTCQQSGQAAVNQGDVLQPSGDVPPGDYCIVLFDIGNVVEGTPVTYSVHIFHK